MIVMKFGGSSVGTAEAIAQVAGIVGRCRDVRPVVVVSALQGVTDELLRLAGAARAGRTEEADAGVAAIAARHADVARALLGAAAGPLEERLAALFADLGHAVRGVALLGELSDRSLDLIVSFGERASAPIVAEAVARAGLAASAVDARALIATDDRYGSANVDFEETGRRVAERLAPIVARGDVPVITGFIGAAPDGTTTTLGRGGSDYSVSILAAALGAEEMWIWKEVDGVMTADPGLVPDAALIPEISYDEAAEMSYFGAKVLHPKTMIPAIGGGIPIRMRNTFRPDAPGTVIGPASTASPSGAKVVTAIKRLSMVTIEGKGMTGIAGFAAHVFDAAGRHRINVLMFSQSSSEQCICLVVDAKDARTFAAALERDLRDAVRARSVDRIEVEDGVAAVAVVGEGMKGKPGVAAKLFTAVAGAGANVLAIAQGSSERSISLVVRESEADSVVRAVHAAFMLHELRVPAYAG
jgi:aspartate kinase